MTKTIAETFTHRATLDEHHRSLTQSATGSRKYASMIHGGIRMKTATTFAFHWGILRPNQAASGYPDDDQCIQFPQRPMTIQTATMNASPTQMGVDLVFIFRSNVCDDAPSAIAR
jgi:hypothetical protein